MSFDLIAPHYRFLERVAFQNKLQSARTAFLDQIGCPKRALVVGEGNGRFLSALLQQHSTIAVDCVDASARMLDLARERIGGEQRVQFLHADLMELSLEKSAYDLIVTHFFLDCFSGKQIADAVAKLAAAANPNASWLIADFAIPKHGLAQIHARLWLRAMYEFFRMTARIPGRELIDPSDRFRAHGFLLAAQSLRQFGLIKSELWRRAETY